MNSILIINSFIITYKLFQISDFVDSLMCWFVVYFSQIVFTELLLGILGILYLENIILLNLLILLVIWLIFKNRISFFSLNGTKDSIVKLLKNKIVLLGISIILGFVLVKVCINLINPPFGWDCLNYHFTFPVEWLKHGNLDTPITISDDPSPTYYPINGSLFFFWLMLPLKNVFLADLGQVPFFILAFLAVYSLARKINLSKEYAFFSASLFTLVPNYFKQLSIAYIDVIVAALFLASLNFLFLLRQKHKYYFKNIILFSLSLGLMIGTKTTALPFAFLLFFPFCIWCYKTLSFKKAFFVVLFSVFFITLAGGFTYIRNLVQTGNPLYPLNFSIFNKLIFKGVIDNAVYKAHTLPGDYNLGKILFSEGLGAQTVIFLLPAIFLALPVTIIKKKENLNFNFIYFLILPFLMILAYRFIVPLANLRYIYALLGIGFIVAFYVINTLNLPKALVKVLIVICLLASVAELAKRQELIISLVVSIALFFILPHIIAFLKNKNLIRYTIFILVLLFVTLMFAEKDYINNEYSRYVKMVKYSGFWPEVARAWEWLNNNTEGNNIAYVGRPVPFPLYGTNFKNNVYYVSVNKTEPAKLHYFPDSHYYWGYDFLSLHNNFEVKGNYRSDADYFVWLNNLLKRNTDYLFIYSLHQTKKIKFPLEDDWAKANPNKFIPVFTNETIRIYKILR